MFIYMTYVFFLLRSTVFAYLNKETVCFNTKSFCQKRRICLSIKIALLNSALFSFRVLIQGSKEDPNTHPNYFVFVLDSRCL